jgi:hypothetical protein
MSWVIDKSKTMGGIEKRIMIRDKYLQRCAWCDQSEGKMTRDRVFPRVIGGTEQLTVPSCRKCQTEISKAETEVGCRSIFALYRTNKGPPPRDKRKPESGAVEARYTLVKEDWIGGYREVVLRAHRDPISLPSIEIDITTLYAPRHGAASEDIGERVILRRRGDTLEDVNRIVKAVLKVVEGPQDESGLLGKIPVELLSEADVDIASDPDFWPRVFFDLRGRLKIRARDGQEAIRLINIVV